MDRFVVGTGRCGSTLLSLMLSEHPQVVCVNEFLGLIDQSRRFVPGAVESSAGTALVTAGQPTVNEVVGLGYTAPEILYPFGAKGVRYSPGDDIPSLLLSCIAHLTDEPDRLYDMFRQHVAGLPTQSMTEHYRSMFAWLAESDGGSIWIERSGASIDFLAELIDHFPDARFVHIHRDGHEAALSMRDYPFMRLGMAILFDLFPETDDPHEAALHVLETPPPLWAAGKFWCDQLLHGFRAIPRLDHGQYLDVRFEDLVSDPKSTLENMAGFLDLGPDPRFSTRAAALVRDPPPLRFPRLDADEERELRAACHAGQVLLGRAD